MIAFEAVHKSYRTHVGRRTILRDATLELPERHNLGILGINGAGKSTLLRLIAGTELPNRGFVRRNVEISFPIGFAGTFHPDLTGRENVRFLARLYGLPVRRATDWVDDFSELGPYFDMPVKTLSSGMFVRLAFSSSLAFDFEVYLIDEATEVGDLLFRQKYVAALRERLTRSTVIVVSHNPATIRTYCNKGAVLHGGDLLLYDSVDEAMVAYEGVLREHIPRSGFERTCPRRLEADLRAGALETVSRSDKSLSLRATDVASRSSADVDRPVSGVVRSAWRAMRRRAVVVSLLLLTVVPASLTAIYLYAVASDQYVAETRFGIRTAEFRADASPIFYGMAAASQIGLDSYVVVQFIQSREMVENLERRASLRSRYERDGIDFIARLPRNASIERVTDYWRGMIETFFDLTNGSVVLRVRAFSPEDSELLANEALLVAQQQVANMTAQVRAEALSMAEAELQRAEGRLKNALRKKEELRTREGMIDPTKVAESTLRAATALREDLAQSKAEARKLIRSRLGNDAPAVSALRNKIASLEAEIHSVETQTAAVAMRQASLSVTTSSFEELVAEERIAEKALSTAIESNEKARATAGRQGSYLLPFVRPLLPEESLYPRRARSVAVVFLVGFAIWAIGWLAVATVREHF